VQQIGGEKLRICIKRHIVVCVPDMNAIIPVYISFKDFLCVLSDGCSLYIAIFFYYYFPTLEEVILFVKNQLV
jgi:hypothetical protein